MIGTSDAIGRTQAVLSRVAKTDASVLILGETGTGKELAAATIHASSRRANGPFVAINCAALTESLLESELFGHERGAFTGAVAQKKGKLEIANGGTLFLDEIGELAPALQAKLLRVLQRWNFERVGGVRSVSVDIRLISATNRNLQESVRAGWFRKDLYFRLGVVSVEMPPLRERREDIPLLAAHFLTRHAQGIGRTLRGIAPDALARLIGYDWPGNVRELENAIEYAVVLGAGEYITPDDLPESVLQGTCTGNVMPGRFHDAVREAKKRVVIETFRQAQHSYADTARRLGLHPNYLHRLIRNLNLKATLEEDALGRSA
jgi:transcriptional regulator with PAS, ATPase and Fis domain